jgi:hypothetical protein
MRVGDRVIEMVITPRSPEEFGLKRVTRCLQL